MTEPQTQEHWSDLYRRYVDEGVFEIRRAEMQPAWDAMWNAGLFPIWGGHRGVPVLGDARDRILEVGCGTGLFLDYLMQHGHKPEHLAGADLSEVAISIAQHTIPLGDFRVYNAAEEPLPWPSETFDVTFSGHTIEHIADPVVMLREMRRVTKAGGHIIVEFPHGDPPYVEHIHSDLNYAQVSEWCEAADIEVVECRPVVEMNPTNDAVLVGRRAS
jgi:SAM-dependent methyltransferase